MTLKEYRQEKDDLGQQNKLKAKYPAYFKFIKEYQEKFYAEDISIMTMGCTYDVYLDLLNEILGDKKPNHIVEYGPGFTTVFIKRILEDIDRPVKFYSYENDAKYYNYLLEKGFDIQDVVEVVDLEVKEVQDTYHVTYNHDLEKHRDVDFVFIDGPGHITLNGKFKPNVNLNLQILSERFNKNISYTIDGRHQTQVYYRNFFSNR